MIDPSDYGLDNLPFGIVTDRSERPRPAVAFGDDVIDLDALVAANALDEESFRHATSLNAFLGRGSARWSSVRSRLQQLLGPDATDDERRAVAAASLPRSSVTTQLPIAIGDYVDFYSSIDHATNFGRIVRPDGAALMPNYRHLPIGYHGRSGTVVNSGTPIVRPSGQIKPAGADAPRFGPTGVLDVELEMGWVAGPGNRLGERISADAVRDHVFGYVLLNDWSARDIQFWEYQPLGPFLGKSFATSISSWIVTLDALEPFRVDEPQREPAPLPYLRAREPWAYDIELEILLLTRTMDEGRLAPLSLSRTNLRGMYWTVAQQLAHVTANGATIRPGDLFGTGTISGPTAGTQGSLFELTWGGRDVITLPTGESRTFLQDGDTVIMRGRAQRDGIRIGFGEVAGTIVG